jgi:lipopolysaccharide export system protein LptA
MIARYLCKVSLFLLSVSFVIIAHAKKDEKESTAPTHITASEIIFEETLNRAIAQGNAVIKRGDATLFANRVEVYFTKVANKNEIKLIKAFENVRIERPENVACGDFGTYDPKKEEIILEGHVTVTDHKNQVSGAYGVMDQKTGVTRILNHRPGTTPPANGRVSALLVSNE